jgi:hypothetical protein
VKVPGRLWLALQRYAAWIEPSLVAEWIRLMHDYAERQGRTLSDAHIARAMAWPEPKRDVARSRDLALRLLDRGDLFCTWTGKRIRERFDIDHLFPWAAWPCSDLWNLLPAHPDVNRAKSDRLPSATMLARAEDRVMAWWRSAYLDEPDSALALRFGLEARASLPSVLSAEPGEVFGGAALQRLRLHRNQQVPEWEWRGA